MIAASSASPRGESDPIVNHPGDPHMQLKDIITTTVETVKPDASLFDAAKIMMTNDLGWLPVTREGKVLGILTDRDIAIRGVAAGLEPRQARVEQVMSRDVFAVAIDDSIEDACNTMEEEQVRRLVVLDENENLVGVVSLADLAAQAPESESADVLKKVTEPD
jgi:CBS domain-containing protein